MESRCQDEFFSSDMHMDVLVMVVVGRGFQNALLNFKSFETVPGF